MTKIFTIVSRKKSRIATPSIAATFDLHILFKPLIAKKEYHKDGKIHVMSAS
jgi:hypothetical protein